MSNIDKEGDLFWIFLAAQLKDFFRFSQTHKMSLNDISLNNSLPLETDLEKHLSTSCKWKHCQ